MLLDEMPHSTMGRLINSRTPDERSIPEEAGDEPLCFWQPEKCLSESVEKTYTQKSLSESLERGFTTFGVMQDQFQKEHSIKEHMKDHSLRKRSVGGLPEMSSPLPITGSSPQDSGGYMPMSPASSEPTRMYVPHSFN